jgi:hypothetical protein
MDTCVRVVLAQWRRRHRTVATYTTTITIITITMPRQAQAPAPAPAPKTATHSSAHRGARLPACLRQAVWAEGDERSATYEVHKYTHTVAFRLSGDNLRDLPTKLDKFSGKRSTYDILNFDNSMTCVVRAWL